jgi:pimeloyl-ACP methyl ester carboxylesterase
MDTERGVLDDLNYLRMAEIFFAQGVADIRAFVGWLFNEGVPAVTLWGVSYGGWLAGLAACHDSRLAAVVLTMPGVCMNHFSVQHEKIVWRRQRESLRIATVNRTFGSSPEKIGNEERRHNRSWVT